MSYDINNNAMQLYAKAAHYMSTGDYELARIYINSVIEKSPELAKKDYVKSLAAEIVCRLIKNE